MPSDDAAQSLVPMCVNGTLNRAELDRYFIPRSDFTYRRFEGITIADADIYQSLFTGSFVRDTHWQRVRFARSDLDGVRMEHSVFEQSDFGTCDIRSSHFARCTFINCDFNNAFIDDCEFRECEFRDCTFAGSSLTHCRFGGSTMSACSLSPGTVLHNRFSDCTITDMTLGNCTFLYVILRRCHLCRVTINAESIGAVFGLTRDDLAHAELLFLGKREAFPPDADRVGLITQEYERRGWYLGALVHALNFDLGSIIGAFATYLARTGTRFITMGFVKGDELEFLGDIIEELASTERLPLLVALDVLQWCASLQSASEDDPKPTDSRLRTFAGRVSLIANALIEKLELALPALQAPQNEMPLHVRATFVEQPVVSLTDLLNELGPVSALPIGQPTSLDRTGDGSFIEVVFTTLFSIMAFQVFLFLINGCVIQLTELKHRVNLLARPQPSKAYADLALIPRQQASPVILSMLQGLTRYASGIPWLKVSSMAGLAAGNIKSLEVLDPEDTRTHPKKR